MHNALLVRWNGGWHEVTDATSIAAHGRSEALLGLGATQSIDEVHRIATKQLEIFANPRTEISADLVPSELADMPYLAWQPSDTVLVPDIDGNNAREQVVALTVAEDENGVVTFAPELKDTILTGRERWEQAIKKMVDGTLQGQSSVATPAAQITSTATTGGQGVSSFEASFSLPGALTPAYSPPITTPVSCTLDEVVVTVRTVAATFRIYVYRDGIEMVDQVIANDAEVTVIAATGASSPDSSLWTIYVSECSVSTADVNITLRFAL